MKKIASFTVNHLTLQRGVYLSRRDALQNGEVITTFDIRMTEPNRQPALSGKSLHAIEHLAATYLRNRNDWAGNYLVVCGDYRPDDILPLLRDTFAFIAGFEGDIPGATARDCGNYSYMDLARAKADASRYLDEVLANPVTEYPQ